MNENHCTDCCCARSWKALGISAYTGQSIPEHIAALRTAHGDVRGALLQAVHVIQTWHNMELRGKDASELWDIYWRNAPEMKPIREALLGLKDPGCSPVGKNGDA